jgi:hypothetical protein
MLWGLYNVSATATAVNGEMAQSPDLVAPRQAQVTSMHRGIESAFPGGMAMARLQATIKKPGVAANNPNAPGSIAGPGMKQASAPEHKGPEQESEFSTLMVGAVGALMTGPAGFVLEAGSKIAHVAEAKGGGGQARNPGDAMTQGLDGRMTMDPAAAYKAPTPAKPAPDRQPSMKFGMR